MPDRGQPDWREGGGALSESLGPEEIRAIRGALTREAFAQLVGVKALSVYRWELPLDAAQARRPRAATVARIREAASRLSAAAAPAPGPEEAGSALALTWTAVLEGRFSQAERELLHLIGHGALVSPQERATAQVSFAWLQLLMHEDAAGAMAALLPVLQADPTQLPSLVLARAHAAATWVHGGQDPRLLDVGRVNHHADEALRLAAGRGHTRWMIWVGRLSATLNVGDVALFLHQASSPPDVAPCEVALVRGVVSELLATAAGLRGDLDECAELLRAAGTPRAPSLLAMLDLERGRPPEVALASVEQARSGGQRTSPRVEFSFLAAEARAFAQQGQLDELERVTRLALALPVEAPPLLLVRPQQVWVFAAEAARGTALLQALSDRLLAHAEGPQGRLVRAGLSYLAALCRLARGELTLRALREVTAGVGDQPGALWLEHDALVLEAWAHAVAGDLEAARATLDLLRGVFKRAPRPGLGAQIELLAGLLAALGGRPAQGLRRQQAALAYYRGAGDEVNAAHAGWTIALSRRIAGEPDAAEEIARAEATLAELGLRRPLVLDRDALEALARDAKAPASTAAKLPAWLVQAVDLLALPGRSPQGVLTTLAREVCSALRCEWVVVEEGSEEGAQAGTSRVLAQEGRAPSSGGVVIPLGGTARDLRLRAPRAAAGEALDLLIALSGPALEAAEWRSQATLPAPSREPTPRIEGLVAASPAMRAMLRTASRLRRSRSTVLIQGESGAGKDQVARAIHLLSRRSEGPWVTLNCTAVASQLFDSQLFGHRRGSFTGAVEDSPGLLRTAHGGTLLLDEVGDLPLELQPKLLRFLDSGEILGVGETKPVQVDVRVIAATHQDLVARVAEGSFREDLFYRLNVIPLRVPPLRERPEDVLAIARAQLGEISPAPVLTPEAAALLTSHTWPGNVRELRNVLERCLALEPAPRVITGQHLARCIEGELGEE